MKISYTHHMPLKPRTPDERLLSAALQGDARKVQKLLVAGASPDAGAAELKGSVLIRAAAAGRLKIVKILLEKGADAGLENYDRRTALMAAVASGKQDVALYLLDARPQELYKRDRQARNVMETAILLGEKQVSAKLITMGFDMTVQDAHSDTAEELIRRAAWDDAEWQPVFELIGQERRDAEEAARRDAERRAHDARSLTDALNNIATARTDIVAPAAVSFKKPKKPAFSPH